MHWNQIEYARGEVVEVQQYPWLPADLWIPGRIAGVHVRPDGDTTYDIQTGITMAWAVSPEKIRRKTTV